METKKKSALAIGGVVFVGCVLIGAGIGNMIDTIDVGASGAIGMGVGFIGMGAIWAYYMKK